MSVILFIVKLVIFIAIIGAIVALLINIGSNKNSPLHKHFKKILAGVVVGVIALFALSSCFVIVPAGSTGVKVVLGKTQGEGLSEGLNFKQPFISKVVIMNNQVQRTDVDSSSSSKDLQAIKSTISVNYKLLPDSSPAIYKNVGKSYEDTIIRPAIQEATKQLQRNIQRKS